MAFIVMINGNGGRPIPMTTGDDDCDDLALFATEKEANTAGENNMLACARGFTVYEWEFPVEPQYMHKERP